MAQRPKVAAQKGSQKGGSQKGAAKSSGKDTKRKEPGRVRKRISRTIMSVGFLRRYYVRRLLKTIDKSEKKGRPLPADLEQVKTALSRLPANKRAEFLEEMLRDPEGMNPGRELRRAASRQDRQSGRGGGRQRPGLPPGARTKVRG